MDLKISKAIRKYEKIIYGITGTEYIYLSDCEGNIIDITELEGYAAMHTTEEEFESSDWIANKDGIFLLDANGIRIADRSYHTINN